MVRLREIPRTASFAWSPGPKTPFIATGTRAGAVDADFSNETCLELWDLGLDKPGTEPTAAAKISTESGFHDLAWAEGDDDSRGVIAGALENGSLDLWDADKLLEGSSDSLISQSSKHTGAIKALQFNPKHSNLLATGGAKGELFISDLNNLESPFRLGNTAARADDIECLDWNKKVSHIMVTGSSAGFVTVWDVKTKKESLTLNNLGRKAVSAVAWDPEKPTKLMTSIPLESDPLILVWDLRNSNAPERTLRAHDSGVLSLSWCAQDPDLLLSSGKDNRTICWSTKTGQPYGEFPVVTNWTFQTRWNPHNPNFFATASFDGKIAVQTIQNTSSEAAQTAASQNQALDGEDFFAKAQTQPQASTFSLPKAPKWLERPSNVSFGFGGRVVSTGLTEPDNVESRSSKIKISTFEVDSKVSSATETFEKSLQEGDLSTICETRIENSQNDEEKADWKVIKTLISGNPRKELVNYLGFSDDTEEAADGLAKLGLDKESNGVPEDKPKPAGGKRHKRLSSIFDGTPDSDSFLTDLAASKGAKTNNPFQIYTGSESEADRRITRALLLGQFEKALSVCLEEDRMSDAFMIAICGGPKCIEKAQEAYFSKQAEGPNYLRLLASVVGKNLWDVVHNADLSNWKEVMASLCTFADEKEFPDLCEALGDRLEEQVKSENNSEARKDASFCYLAGSKLEKVVASWIDELQENEKNAIENAEEDSSFSIHVRALQTLIEKVTIFRQVTNFQDEEKQKTSDWKLGILYDKYLEYANVVATHGQLQIAEKYLDLLPDSHPEAEVARNRIKLATRKAAPKAAERQQPAASSRLTPKPVPQPSPFQAQTSYTPAAPGPTNPYAPPAASQPPASYGGAPTGYTPSGYQPPQHQMRPSVAAAPVPPPPQSFGAPPPGPPRAQNDQPSVSSYANATNLPAWNDLPEGFVKPPTSRRGTPSAGGRIGSPFPNQHAGAPAPGQPPTSQQMTSPPPVAPPPKGPPPPRMTPPPTGPPQGYQAPEAPSSAASAYGAPAPGSQGMPPPIQRGQSPYNAPPTGPPPSNRYAPNPAAQAAGQPQARGPMAPPPPPQASAAHPPPPSAYAPPQAQMPSQNPYAPGSPQQPMHQEVAQPPPPGPAPGSRPSTAQSQKKASPAPQKYPPGDRTHIPSNAQPIYEILSSDMQRIKARAPSQFKTQVNDTDRRLNMLFDHLNNEDLLKPNTIDSMVELAQALQAKNYDAAQAIHVDILTNRTDECGNWMVGIKRLIAMSRATP